MSSAIPSHSSSHSSTQPYSVRPSALYRAEQVVELDRLVMQHEGVSATVLMKRAGRHAFGLLLEQWPDTNNVQIFCGSGNNGGDGYVLAALAKQRNIDVTVWAMPSSTGELFSDALSSRANEKPAVYAAYQYAVNAGVECRVFDADVFLDSQLMLSDDTVLVDALLGTGFQAQPESQAEHQIKPQIEHLASDNNHVLSDTYVAAVQAINQAKQQKQWPILAIDIPTGVNPNTGAVASVAINANATLSFIGQKQGLFTGEGRSYSGDRYYSDLEVDHEWLHLVNPSTQIMKLSALLKTFPIRDSHAYKNQCGHVVVIGGDVGASYGYGGAPIMAAQMALRTGAGLVSLATRPDYVTAALARQPEMMVAGIDNGQALLPLLARATGIVVGPGLGRSAWSEQLLYQVLEHTNEHQKPVVIDADALHLLSEPRFADMCTVAVSQRQWILTPHAGEAASLLGVSVAQVESDRFATAQAIQQQYGGAVVLKGAGTIVVLSSGAQYLCDAGNAGMASGGMGDVLSGLLGALIVQGMSIDDAALLGTLLHSTAADQAVQKTGMRGLLATDLLAEVQQLMTNTDPS